MTRIYGLINSLSLDVAVGAAISGRFLAEIIGAQMPLATQVVLGLTVWCIYTFDHLMDARKKEGELSSERHLFHKKHYGTLTRVLLLVLILDGLLVFFLPTITLVYGVFLGFVVLVYFLSIHLMAQKAIVHKELTIAIIYTSGICLGALSTFEGSFQGHHYIILVSFFLIVLLNLLIFSFLDRDADQSAHFPSLVQSLGMINSQRLITILSVLAAASIMFIFWYGNYHEALMLLIMFMILQLLFWFARNRLLKENYRYLGDGIFLLPILQLL